MTKPGATAKSGYQGYSGARREKRCAGSRTVGDHRAFDPGCRGERRAEVARGECRKIRRQHRNRHAGIGTGSGDATPNGGVEPPARIRDQSDAVTVRHSTHPGVSGDHHDFAHPGAGECCGQSVAGKRERELLGVGGRKLAA